MRNPSGVSCKLNGIEIGIEISSPSQMPEQAQRLQQQAAEAHPLKAFNVLEISKTILTIKLLQEVPSAKARKKKKKAAAEKKMAAAASIISAATRNFLHPTKVTCDICQDFICFSNTKHTTCCVAGCSKRVCDDCLVADTNCCSVCIDAPDVDEEDMEEEEEDVGDAEEDVGDDVMEEEEEGSGDAQRVCLKPCQKCTQVYLYATIKPKAKLHGWVKWNHQDPRSTQAFMELLQQPW